MRRPCPYASNPHDPSPQPAGHSFRPCHRLRAEVSGAEARTAPAAHPTSTPYAGDLNIFEEPWPRHNGSRSTALWTCWHLKPGSTVADIGAGGGWFSVRAARRVAPNGRVIAEDINPKAIAYIQKRAQREDLANIEPLLGTPDDPKLEPNSSMLP